MAQLLLKLCHYQNCCSYVQTIALPWNMIHINRVIRKETANFVETLIRRGIFFNTGPVKEVCGVWRYFCNIKCDGNYIINAPCSTVHSYHSQTLLNNFCNICFIKCNYFSFTFMYSKIFHWTPYSSYIFIFLSNCSYSLHLSNLIDVNRVSFYPKKTLH
jgi:hypothetical protein